MIAWSPPEGQGGSKSPSRKEAGSWNTLSGQGRNGSSRVNVTAPPGDVSFRVESTRALQWGTVNFQFSSSGNHQIPGSLLTNKKKGWKLGADMSLPLFILRIDTPYPSSAPPSSSLNFRNAIKFTFSLSIHHSLFILTPKIKARLQHSIPFSTSDPFKLSSISKITSHFHYRTLSTAKKCDKMTKQYTHTGTMWAG